MHSVSARIQGKWKHAWKECINNRCICKCRNSEESDREAFIRGKVMIDLEGAQFAMAMLAVLQEKTKGNLTADESSELLEVISHLHIPANRATAVK